MSGHGPLTRGEVLLALVCEATEMKDGALQRYFVPGYHWMGQRWCALLSDHVTEGGTSGDASAFRALVRRGWIAAIADSACKHAFRATEDGLLRYEALRAQVAASGWTPHRPLVEEPLDP